MTLRIHNLFRSLQELSSYCERNPDFPAFCGLECPIELWTFNPVISLAPVL